MPRKETAMDMIADGVRRLTSATLASLTKELKLHLRDLFIYAQHAVADTVSYVAKRVLAILLVFLGICFVIVSAILALVYYARFGAALSFLIIGVILVIGSIIYILILDSRAKNRLEVEED